MADFKYSASQTYICHLSQKHLQLFKEQLFLCKPSRDSLDLFLGKVLARKSQGGRSPDHSSEHEYIREQDEPLGKTPRNSLLTLCQCPKSQKETDEKTESMLKNEKLPEHKIGLLKHHTNPRNHPRKTLPSLHSMTSSGPMTNSFWSLSGLVGSVCLWSSLIPPCPCANPFFWLN